MRTGLAIAVLLGLPAPALAASYCTDNWSDMAGAVAANGLAPPMNLQQLAAGRVPGKLVKISLCKAGYGYQYQLVFLDPSGQLVTLPVDAKNPFGQ
jgi:hypothetical protein